MNKKLLTTIILSFSLLWTGCGSEPIQDVALTTKQLSLPEVFHESMPPLFEEQEVLTPATANQVQEKEEANKIIIASVGDIMMHDAEIKSGSLGNGSYDYSIMFRSIKPYIEKADFALGNLETTLSGKEKGYTGYPAFNSPEILAKNIKDAGFDLVTTANNHSLDRGFYGVVKTIENLDKVGLIHTGSFKSKEDSGSIIVQDIKGIKVAFLAYTYGTNGITVPERFAVNLIDRSKMFEDIRKAKNLKADMIIASLHFGVEYNTKMNKTQEDLVNFMFSSGADIVLGSHPHVLQPMEVKKVKDVYGIEKDRFVIYSQGNIVANMPERYKNSGVVLNISIQKDKSGTQLEKVEYIPTVVDAYYNEDAKKTTFEILPLLGVSDYSKHKQNSVIRQSFNDTIATLKSDSSKISLVNKK